MSRGLRLAGIDAMTARSLDDALQSLRRDAFDAVVVDVRLPQSESDLSGLDLVRHCSSAGGPPAVVLTGSTDVRVVRAACLAGPAACLLKVETTPRALAEHLRRLLQRREVTTPAAPVMPTALAALVGESDAMHTLREQISRIAPRTEPVLITGESGVGKQLVADALHALSGRLGPYETLNVTAAADGLFEAAMFGHVRGAFTGADRDVAGAFERTTEGTLFLDEIGELPIHLQPKLLRAVEYNRVRRVGAAKETPTHTRLICATHAPLATLVEKKLFRGDLFYRLNVQRLRVPSLAERGNDVATLVATFAKRERISIAPDAINWLAKRRFPGNVRELRHVVARLAVLGVPVVHRRDAELALFDPDQNSAPLRLRTRHLEDEAIQSALSAAGGNASEAARRLGLSRSSLLRRLQRS